MSKQNIAKHKRTACKLNKQTVNAESVVEQPAVSIQVVDVAPQQIEASNLEVEQPKTKATTRKAVAVKAKSKASTREAVLAESSESDASGASTEEVPPPKPQPAAKTKRQTSKKKVEQEPDEESAEIIEPKTPKVITRVDKLRNLAKQGLA